MSVAARLAGFVAAVGLLFGGAAAAGGMLDPDAPGARAEVRPHAPAPMAGMGGGAHGAKAMAVRGLAVAENGLRLVVEDPELRRGRGEQLRFRVVRAGGRAVRDFDVEHTKRMHLIVARRDLTSFQHLHPRMAADGTWSTRLRLRAAGSYRVFADFSHDGKPTTLASDLRVDGDARLQALPAPATAAKSDGGYDVRMTSGAARAGEESELRFAISRHGRPVRVEPYLGADGHLVALREGDLAFLHVHPTDHGDGDAIGFETTFPTAGSYRLFVQFEHEGRIQTVAFTEEVR